MEKLTYKEIKEMLLDDYSDLIENEGFTPEQAIAAMLEDSVLLMKKDSNNYISTVIGLSLIALKENILPDYLYDRIIKLDNNNFNGYDDEDLKLLLVDKNYINKRINTKNYTLLQDEAYKTRVSMLLGEL